MGWAGQAGLPQTTRCPADGTGNVGEDQGQRDGTGVYQSVRGPEANTISHIPLSFP
jgi:hypothetical protein